MSRSATGFAAVIPVKSPAIGKSRLTGVADRAALARAIAMDTVTAVTAASAVRQVVVVTDTDFAPVASGLGATVVADPGSGLNAALLAGAGVAAERWPELQPVAILADLPALTGVLLDTALAQVGGSPSYCRDGEGTGTTLYTAAYDGFDPRFGAGSAEAHASAGAVEIEGELAGLRRDVDDVASLDAALLLGVGPATSVLLGR